MTLNEETERALELYNGHTDALNRLKAAQDYVQKSMQNGLSVASQQLVDRFSELQSAGMSAADALTAVGGSLDLRSMDDLRTFNGLLKEVEQTGVDMSNELRDAFGKIIGDLDINGLENLRTTINATFTDANDRARVLGKVIQSGLSDELERPGLSFQELETGIDASAQQAVDDFKAVVAIIKETGTEAGIAEQAIADAYAAAKEKVGDSTEAINQLNGTLEEAGDEGLISGDKIGEAMNDAANKTEQSGSRIVESHRLVTEGMKDIETEAERVETALTKASEAAQALAQFVGDYVNSTTSSLNELSQQTANLFSDKMGMNTTPILTDIEQLQAAMKQAESAAIEAQTSFANIGVDTTGLNSYINKVNQASNQASAAFYRQKLSYQDLMEEINNGDLSGNQLIEAAESAVRRFNLLDSQDLDNLESAIVSARNEMEALNDSASNTLTSLQNELDRLKGDYDAVEQRQYEQKKEELEALIEEARAAGNTDAIDSYRESLKVLEAIRKEQIAQAKAEAEEEAAAAENESSSSSNSSSSSSSKSTSDSRSSNTNTNTSSVNLNLPSGTTATLSGSSEDVDAFLDYLAQAQLSTAE